MMQNDSGSNENLAAFHRGSPLCAARHAETGGGKWQNAYYTFVSEC